MTETPPVAALTRCGHVALAGAPNAGKSTLLNALVGEHLAIVSPRAQTTRHPVIGLRTEDDVQYVFHDLPGLLDPAYALQARLRTMALEGLAGADVILHLHPADEAPAPSLALAAGLPREPRVPVIIVYTKGDLLSPQARVSLAETGAEVVSASKARGLGPLLHRVRGLLPPGPFQYAADDVGAQPLRFFVTEYLREAAFALLGEEVPYCFAAEVEEFREGATPVYIRATLLVERDSQRGIVIGKGGRTIRALGTRARQRLETLLGQPVYLDCWVKVLPGWRRDPALLERLGFPPERP